MEPIEVQLKSLWECVHPSCKKTPESSWQDYPSTITVRREGESTVLAVSVEGNDFLTLRLNVEEATALVEQIQA